MKKSQDQVITESSMKLTQGYLAGGGKGENSIEILCILMLVLSIAFIS